MIQHETSHADGKTYTLARYSLSNHFFYYAPGMLKLSRWSIASVRSQQLARRCGLPLCSLGFVCFFAVPVEWRSPTPIVTALSLCKLQLAINPPPGTGPHWAAGLESTTNLPVPFRPFGRRCVWIPVQPAFTTTWAWRSSHPANPTKPSWSSNAPSSWIQVNFNLVF